MTVYLDSSVLLRRLLQQPHALKEWRLVRTPITSRIAEVECLRTLDRMRLNGTVDDRRLTALREGLYRILAALEIVEVTRTILGRAAQPSPTSLGTLDAIHLCSAVAWQERTGRSPMLATHDQALAQAARAQGLRVLGL